MRHPQIVPYPSASKHEVHCLSCAQIPYTTDMYFNCRYIKSCLDFITKHQVTTGGGDMGRCLGKHTSDHNLVLSRADGYLSSVGLPGPKQRAHTSLTREPMLFFP